MSLPLRSAGAPSASPGIRHVFRGRAAGFSRRALLAGALQSLALLAACSTLPSGPASAPTDTADAVPPALSRSPACALAPIVLFAVAYLLFQRVEIRA